jgi:hypothetical protein
MSDPLFGRNEPRVRTNSRVLEYDVETGIVYPFYSISAIDIIPLGECLLEIPGLEVWRKIGEDKDARDAGGEGSERLRHEFVQSKG